MAESLPYTQLEYRIWKVKNGVYEVDSSLGGAPLYWVLLALNPKLSESKVLAVYSSEDDIYCFDYDHGETEKWAEFLQNEAVRLAEEKGLVPEETTILICESFSYGGFSGQIDGGPPENISFYEARVQLGLAKDPKDED
jgi:hypothetical protein